MQSRSLHYLLSPSFRLCLPAAPPFLARPQLLTRI
jgi:hypothetical protein